jgi:hypothetical protein
MPRRPEAREDVRGPREQEAAGSLVSVDGFLDREEEVRRALDLVDQRPAQFRAPRSSRSDRRVLHRASSRRRV